MVNHEPTLMAQTDSWQASSLSYTYNNVTTVTLSTSRPDADWVTSKDEDGDTLLHITVAKGNESACNKLVGILKERKLSLDVKNKLMQTPLHIACIAGNCNIAKLLLTANHSSCDVTDRHGDNCVHLAIKYNRKSNQSDTLRTVLTTASSSALNKRNIYGLSPMHVAASEGNVEAIRLLKQGGADLNILENKAGATPIILAARSSQREAAQALLELGANPNYRTTFGESASLCASAKGDLSMAELLASYDTSYDVSRHVALPRGVGFETGSFSEFPLYSVPPDVKAGPFVRGGLFPSLSLVKAREEASCSTQSVAGPSNQTPFVKSERRSPTSAYPRGSDQPSKDCSSDDSDPQPINYTVRKKTEPVNAGHSDSPPMVKRNPKRQLECSQPLDLSIKKMKMTKVTPACLEDNHQAEQPATNRRSNFAIVHPIFHHSSALRLPPPPYGYDVMPNPYMVRSIPVSLPLPGLPTTSNNGLRSNNDAAGNLIQPIMKQNAARDSRHPASLPPFDLPHPTANSDSPLYSSRTHPNSSKKQQPSVAAMSAYGIKPTVTNLNEPCDRFQTVRIRSAESSISPQTITGCTRKAREPDQVAIQNYLDVRASEKCVAADEQERLSREYGNLTSAARHKVEQRKGNFNQPVQATSMTETRFQSDKHCSNELTYRPDAKQFLSRRNSLSSNGRMVNDKLDLHSYTGCLPPHYLHLLESSGNLPTKASNALKNVSDVFQDETLNCDVAVKNDRPVKGNRKDTNVLPKVNASDAKSSSPPEATQPNTNLISISPCATPPLISSSVANSTSSVKSSFSFDGLGDWSSFKKGDYPAFDNPYVSTSCRSEGVSDKDSISADFRVNHEYISEETKEILRSVTMEPKTTRNSRRLGYRVTTDKDRKHACACCTGYYDSNVPSLIENIWKFTPSKKYVTASSATSWNTVYSGEITFKRSSPEKQPSNTRGDKPITSCTTAKKLEVESVGNCYPSRKSLDVTLEQIRQQRAMIPHNDHKKETRLNEEIAKSDKTANDLRVVSKITNGTAEKSPTHNLNNYEDNDILANSIEESSDDERDVEAAKISLNRSPRWNGARTPDSHHSAKDPGDKITSLLRRNELTVLQHKRDIVRKTIRPGQSNIFKPHNRICSTTDDVRICDLEISEDEDGNVELEENTVV